MKLRYTRNVPVNIPSHATRLSCQLSSHLCVTEIMVKDTDTPKAPIKCCYPNALNRYDPKHTILPPPHISLKSQNKKVDGCSIKLPEMAHNHESYCMFTGWLSYYTNTIWEGGEEKAEE